jgi:hypothetical protein
MFAWLINSIGGLAGWFGNCAGSWAVRSQKFEI